MVRLSLCAGRGRLLACLLLASGFAGLPHSAKAQADSDTPPPFPSSGQGQVQQAPGGSVQPVGLHQANPQPGQSNPPPPPQSNGNTPLALPRGHGG